MSSVPLRFLSVLSLCLQEEGVVSFCKVCAVGLISNSFYHLSKTTTKHSTTTNLYHPSCSYASHTPPVSMCHRAYGIKIPITLLERLLKLTIPCSLEKLAKIIGSIVILSFVGSPPPLSCATEFIFGCCLPLFSAVKREVVGSASWWLWFLSLSFHFPMHGYQSFRQVSQRICRYWSKPGSLIGHCCFF